MKLLKLIINAFGPFVDKTVIALQEYYGPTAKVETHKIYKNKKFLVGCDRFLVFEFSIKIFLIFNVFA